MSQSPKISVVLPIYNGFRFLNEAIESVLNQTFSDFEFIIWNDGSTNQRCEEIVKSYKDDRIRYFYHENTGCGQAMNLAISKACGKYIARMDDDDVCLPDRFQKEYDFLESHPDYVFVSSSIYYINDSGKIMGVSLPYTRDEVIRRVKGTVAQPSAMFLREAFNKTEGYPAVRFCEDAICWSKLNKQGKFANLKDTLLKHRILESSLSRGKDSNSPYFKIVMILLDKMIKDDMVRHEDVELFNCILAQVPKVPSKIYRVTPMYERVYNVLSYLIGEKMAKDVIIYLKDLYGLYKYKK
jgi:glycosyltransferase involved in cell wall biosynthesis